ncbi:MAG: recombinase family protein [Bosea sp.]|uniref:recombinase family protein n=1 Tax=Bosea sp. (in: a-proteobacteria) TaxID=1871050 RepID=UPI001AD55B88|nr:recombinase family protein [Bosea sp. (in: a-proteobacteria)]MBN9471081.1 recombinase family protein [Bosea sp. (in: a-proteobacteria)]
MNVHAPVPTSNLSHLYRRVSSASQLAGDGLDRQYKGTLRYLKEKGLVVVREYEDRGVSAFRGRNRRSGQLATILENIRRGVIKSGEHLIIESLDRLSRQPIFDALQTMKDILSAGVTIHSVFDGLPYTLETVNREQWRANQLLNSMMRGHEESRIKSERVAEAYENGRQTGKIVAGRIPTWLRIEKDKDGKKVFKVNDDVAKIVNDIFEMARDGLSSYKIAQELKRRGIAPFGEQRKPIGSKSKGSHHWNATSILNILTRKTVLGEYRPTITSYDENGKRIMTPAGVLPNYYKEIVTPELWQAANDAIQSRKRRGSMGQGRKGADFANILKDTTICSHCGNPMHIKVQREHRTLARYTRLRCAGKSEGVCGNSRSPRYLVIENAVLDFVSEVELVDRRSDEAAALQRDIATENLRVESLDDQIRTVITNFLSTQSSVAVQMVSELEAEKARLVSSLETKRSKLASIASSQSPEDRKTALKELRATMAALEPVDGDNEAEKTSKAAQRYAVRAKLNLKIKEVIDRIEFSKDGTDLVIMRDESVFYAFEDKVNGLRITKFTAPRERDPSVEATFEGLQA